MIKIFLVQEICYNSSSFYRMVHKSSGLKKVLAGDLKDWNFLCSEPTCLWMCEVLREKTPRITSHLFGHNAVCLCKKEKKKKSNLALLKPRFIRVVSKEFVFVILIKYLV